MKKNYILDTNVIVSDPSSIFKFEDNNIYIPIFVLEELDNFKGEASERGKSSRVFSRYLDDLREAGNLSEGILMPDGGKLVVYVPEHRGTLLMAVKPNSVDSDIISCALQIKNSDADTPTILVTMDMNLRIRADVLGVSVQNYNSQNVKIEEGDLGIVDIYVLPHLIDEFYTHGSLPEDALSSNDIEKLYPNANVILHSIDGTNKSALCRYNDNKLNKLILPKEGILGIKPKNVEQTFALDMLIDDRIKLVMISGAAGSGKTVMTIAAGLYKVLKEQVYNKLTLTRTIASVGKNNELGYLPGTESEKILPLFKGSLDNLELLLMNKELKSLLPKDTKGMVNLDKFLHDGPISLESMAYIRGRSLPNQMIVCEEAQNSSIHELKTILSRSADGTKAIVIGDLQQIDVAYLTQNNCGLSILMEKLKKKNLSAYIKLQKCHRSELADMVITNL